MRKVMSFVITMVCVMLLAGCKDTSRPADLPPLYSCVLVITQDNKPLDGAVVELVPIDEANAKYRSSSATDADGNATMTTYGFDGVPAGQYKVCVWKTVIEGVTQYTNNDGELVNTNGTEYRTVEQKYSTAKTTPHEIEVTKKTLKTTFDVGKPIKAVK